MNIRQKQVNHEMKKLGFGGLDDPQIIQQMAFCIQDHEHFRKVLLSVSTGEQRKVCYDVMRPHLRFEAKPLDWYIMRGKQEAEELQLPIQNADGTFTPFKDYHPRQSPLEAQAEKALKESGIRDQAKGALQLVCSKCTREGIYYALDAIAAYAAAQRHGWVFQKFARKNSESGKIETKEVSICPRCPAARLEAASA
ncbi:MAG TPA: hypothetical protein VHX11_08940 [Acidobacteriaceae bacterium]|jgi:hypothetical protein|nr:hypothetical protein [Acidobacteriaceae bacterium]